MSSAGIFPEKFAMYFSSMNSLSGKIYSDIQCTEESMPVGLSYSEKCGILDKRLIQDVLDKSGYVAKGHALDFLDEDQVKSILLSVYPKKPEKYVFEENGVWVDEHSQPFSFCKQSQAKSCPLAELIQNLPNLTTTKLTNTTSNRKPNGIANGKIKKEFDSDGKPACMIEEHHGIIEAEDEEVVDAKMKPEMKQIRAPSFFGVNVMGFMGSDSQNQKAVKITAPVGEKLVEEEDEESNLPKQKQNFDLIAELQAKLKKTNSGGKAGIGHVQPSKVSKPKAPPPPPPQTDANLKRNSGLREEKKEEANNSNNPAEDVKEAKESNQTKSPLLQLQKSIRKEPTEFCVDVSSPCRIATPKTGLDFLDNW